MLRLTSSGFGPSPIFPRASSRQGQKRKLALSRLFAAHRPIWLLDEPSVSLDPASVKLLERAIARHLTRGGIALIASHVGLNVKCKHRLVLGRGGNR